MSNYDYPFNGAPSLLEQRGLGNYFLDIKGVYMTLTEKIEVYHHRYLIDNCGRYLPVLYSSISGDETRYMTTNYSFHLYQSQIDTVTEVPAACVKWKDGYPDDTVIKQLPKNSHYSFKYHTIWNGTDFYSCPKKP